MPDLPVFVFPQQLGPNNAKIMGDAIGHEVFSRGGGPGGGGAFSPGGGLGGGVGGFAGGGLLGGGFGGLSVWPRGARRLQASRANSANKALFAAGNATADGQPVSVPTAEAASLLLTSVE